MHWWPPSARVRPSQVSQDPRSLHSDPPRREPSFDMSTRQLGMNMFLASLAVLFVGSIVAYLLTRYNHSNWAEVEATLPNGMLASGIFLVGVSSSLELALRSIRKNSQHGLKLYLSLAGVFAAAFLVGQSLNWLSMMNINAGHDARLLSLFVFYMLTALHALHVLAGFVPLGLVIHRARQREYSSSRHEGVKLCVQYWHFLGVVWLVLMGVMFAT